MAERVRRRLAGGGGLDELEGASAGFQGLGAAALEPHEDRHPTVERVGQVRLILRMAGTVPSTSSQSAIACRYWSAASAGEPVSAVIRASRLRALATSAPRAGSPARSARDPS